MTDKGEATQDTQPFMVDLYSGRKGASAAMADRGWRTVTVDLDPAMQPDVVADVRALPLRCRPDLVWASPPCDEFSRESMPWCRTGVEPSLELVEAAVVAIERLRPRWWVIENVRGSAQHISTLLGPHVQRIGAQYLWGVFPLLLVGQRPTPSKMRQSGVRPDLRAVVPYEISMALALAVESMRTAA